MVAAVVVVVVSAVDAFFTGDELFSVRLNSLFELMVGICLAAELFVVVPAAAVAVAVAVAEV